MRFLSAARSAASMSPSTRGTEKSISSSSESKSAHERDVASELDELSVSLSHERYHALSTMFSLFTLVKFTKSAFMVDIIFSTEG